MKDKVIIFGASGHAEVVAEIVEILNYEVVGLIDVKQNIGKKFKNYSIIGNEEDLSTIAAKYQVTAGIVAIGENYLRQKIVEKIVELMPNFNFINAIHPSSVISPTVTMGHGNVIIAGSIINSGTHLGNHCILNTLSSLDHDGKMYDYAHLAPGVHCGGFVSIGERSFIGIGASIIHGVKIGSDAVIGAGSAVIADIDPFTINIGIPAKFISKRIKEQKYL